MERRKFTREFKLEAVRLIKDRGVSYAQAAQDLGVHPTQLRDWVKKFAEDPQHSFPGQGQMKPEQLEIARLKREVTKLKAERDMGDVGYLPSRRGKRAADRRRTKTVPFGHPCVGSRAVDFPTCWGNPAGKEWNLAAAAADAT